MSLVLDASSVLAWIFERTDSGEAALAERLLADLASESAWVPGLWFLEVANTLLIAQRRGVATEARIVDYLQRLKRLPIEVDDATMALAKRP